jgi:hypothetical protein
MRSTQRCSVINCTKTVWASGYCNTHYMRWKRHGTTEQTRPKDWGAREKHPLYVFWCSLRRQRRDIVCAEWLKDFWAFANEVKERPEGPHRAMFHRRDENKLFGPGNWYWSAPKLSAEGYEDKREYMRDWQRKARKENPDYFRNMDLKRMYGVTLEWYEQKLKEQNHRCAICKRKENMEINGKVVRLAVDHCHQGSGARGLLCQLCNRGLGFFRHSKKRLREAVAYLERFD